MNRRGVTLVELLVSLAVLGLLAALAGPALRTVVPHPAPSRDDLASGARRDAIRTRRAIHLLVPTDTSPVEVHATPDGRVLLSDTSDSLAGTARAR